MFNINKKQIIVISIILGIMIIVIYYFYKNNIQEEFDIEKEPIIVQNEMAQVEEEPVKEELKIVVHIIGQVINPGIVELKENSRVIDAIQEAGGATPEADLSKINLAYILQDGEKIKIPSINDKESDTQYVETRR